MTIPAYMFIQAAVSELAGRNAESLKRQAAELAESGAAARLLTGEGVDGTSHIVTPDFETGYALGLETARVLLAGGIAPEAL